MNNTTLFTDIYLSEQINTTKEIALNNLHSQAIYDAFQLVSVQLKLTGTILLTICFALGLLTYLHNKEKISDETFIKYTKSFIVGLVILAGLISMFVFPEIMIKLSSESVLV